MLHEYAVVNKGRTRRKKRGRPRKKTTTRRRRRVAAKSYSRPRRNPARRRTYRRRRTTRRRAVRRNPAVSVNPIERDLVKTLKDGALMAIGAIGAYALADYAKQKVSYVAENANLAVPAVMVGGGVALGMVLKGKNKRLATVVGFGAVTVGLLTAALPYIRDKVPGLPDSTYSVAAAPTAPTVGAYERTGMSGYVPSLSGRGTDPFASQMHSYGYIN